MTLSDLIRESGELGARSDRIKSDLKGWVNRGQRAICQRHNFSWMHSQQSVTITAGNTSANLPATFKELSAARSPITYTAPASQFPTPVNVLSRAELERMPPGASGNVVNASGSWSPFYVFLEKNDGGLWTINIPLGFPVATAVSYALSCYLFPADLSLGTDHNTLTDDTELAEALINWTRSKAYLSQDPPDAQSAQIVQAEYENTVRRAIGQDARKVLAGRRLRM